jgi:hypothetical protein
MGDKTQDYVLGNSQPSPFGKLRAGSADSVSQQEQIDPAECFCYPKPDLRELCKCDREGCAP